MTTKIRTILIAVPERQRTSPNGVFDVDGIAFLESLRADVAAFAGMDAQAPMRRDLLRKVTPKEARDDDR